VAVGWRREPRMTGYLRFSAQHPRLAVLLLAAITLAALTQLGDLRIDVSVQGMAGAGHPARADYERILQRFGDDELTIVFVGDDDLFQPSKLAAIGQTVQALEALEWVARTDSLFSVNDVQIDSDWVTARPYLAEIPPTRELAAAIREAALANPLVAGNLLAADGRALAINVYLSEAGRAPERAPEVSAQLEQTIDPLRSELQTVFQYGTPAVRQAVGERIGVDQARILPLALGVLLLALALSQRSLDGALVPLITGLLSVIWILGLMAALAIPINVMTSIVPALLIIVGATEDVHLLVEYRAAEAAGYPPMEAIDVMAGRMGLAVSLTFVTSYLGFLAIAVNELDVLREFGLVASTGLFLNFVATVLVVPLAIRVLRRLTPNAPARPPPGLYQRLVEPLFALVQARRLLLGMLCVLITVAALFGARSLRVDNDPLDYLGEGSEIRRQAQVLQQRLAGIQTLSCVLDSGIEGTFQKVRYLREIEKLQRFLSRIDGFDKTVSVADFIGLANARMEEWEVPSLPGSDAIVEELVRFLRAEDLRPYVSADFSQARILVRHSVGSSLRLNELLERIERFAHAEIDPGLRLTLTGASVLEARAADQMAVGQAQSLLLMIAVIFVIISVLFVSFKAGAIAVVANLFPIALLFGAMGFFGIPLNTGTAMVAAIAIGICVDDTMHFMVRYNRQLNVHKDESGALGETLRAEAVPIIATSTGLMAGFATLTASSFPPVVHFGLLSTLVIGLALLATFIVTPMLLSATGLLTVWDMLSLNLRSRLTRQCPLFANLRPWQIRKVILVCNARAYPRGEYILRKGEEGDEMFVLLDGRAEVRFGPPGAGREPIPLRVGDVFGEVAVMTRTRRTADIVALDYTRVLVLEQAAIGRLVRFYPRISARLFLNLGSIVGDRLAGLLKT